MSMFSDVSPLDGRPTAPITVCMPTIPPRTTPSGPEPGTLLWEAIDSVRRQTLVPAGGLAIAIDMDRRGAAHTRQQALEIVGTDWVAFLDDDDTWYPHHLETLYTLVVEHDADFAYSWFDGNNPFPMHRGRQMDPANPHHTTMNVLVRTELAKRVGFEPLEGHAPHCPAEDWRFILGCLAEDAKFIGTGEITWTYRVHAGNTSGLPSRW